MNTKTYFGVIVALVLVHFQSAYAGLGDEGERANCVTFTKLLNPLVPAIVNPIIETPCEILTCLFDVTCEVTCDSRLVTTVEQILNAVLSIALCNGKLVACPDNLAVETCLGPSRKAIGN